MRTNNDNNRKRPRLFFQTNEKIVMKCICLYAYARFNFDVRCLMGAATLSFPAIRAFLCLYYRFISEKLCKTLWLAGERCKFYCWRSWDLRLGIIWSGQFAQKGKPISQKVQHTNRSLKNKSFFRECTTTYLQRKNPICTFRSVSSCDFLFHLFRFCICKRISTYFI